MREERPHELRGNQILRHRERRRREDDAVRERVPPALPELLQRGRLGLLGRPAVHARGRGPDPGLPREPLRRRALGPRRRAYGAGKPAGARRLPRAGARRPSAGRGRREDHLDVLRPHVGAARAGRGVEPGRGDRPHPRHARRPGGRALRAGRIRHHAALPRVAQPAAHRRARDARVGRRRGPLARRPGLLDPHDGLGDGTARKPTRTPPEKTLRPPYPRFCYHSQGFNRPCAGYD